MTEEPEALAYDLDGTLVRLETDWEAARSDAAAVLRSAGVDTTEMGLWSILEAAGPNGVLDRVSGAIETHERRGARAATRLALANELPQPVPVGVCSLNSEAACRIALEVHDLDAHVDTVVGRDSVGSYKPDPEPLLRVIEALGADPHSSLFVGDSERDELAAERAGVDFQWTDSRLGRAPSD